MEITEVRIKLMDEGDDRLQGFCSITFDGEFVVRDLKIINGQKGPFVAMPSRKLTEKCHRCFMKNEIRARYCSNCGARTEFASGATSGGDNRSRLFADIAHPINSECRQKIQDAVLRALDEERVRAREPGYVCTYDDFDEYYATSRSESMSP
ncbi:MAG: SpoVG family protein [Planctomycetaceae bacterium]